MYYYSVNYGKDYRYCFLAHFKRPIREGQIFRWEGEEWYAESVDEVCQVIYAHRIDY